MKRARDCIRTLSVKFVISVLRNSRRRSTTAHRAARLRIMRISHIGPAPAVAADCPAVRSSGHDVTAIRARRAPSSER
jgi:hypothetical protein